MHSFLIQDPNYEIKTSFDTLVITPENSIGIEEVRQIQTFLSHKPSQSNQNLVYIKDAHLLTLAAQNALLKILEEPPGNSQIYLLTTQPDLLLATVVSRVQVEKYTPMLTTDTTLFEKTEEILTKVKKANKGERLAIVDSLGLTREQALQLVANIEMVLHKNLNLGLNYESLIEARKNLKTNVNVKLALDHLFLNL